MIINSPEKLGFDSRRLNEINQFTEAYINKGEMIAMFFTQLFPFDLSQVIFQGMPKLGSSIRDPYLHARK